MKRLLSALFLSFPFLAACSGGSSTATSVPGTPSAPDAVSRALDEAQSTIRQKLHEFSTNDLLYVSNIGNNSITVYQHNAHNDAAPVAVIAGSNTGINNPGQLSEDAQGNLYVINSIANGVANTNPAVLVFAHGANGNVAAIRKLAGPNTGLKYIGGITVDQTTGKIFVVNSARTCPQQGYTYNFFCVTSLLRFPPNANGNTAPFAASSPAGDLFPSIQIDSDSTGNNIIEAHTVAAPQNEEFGMDTYVKQFPNGAPLRDIYDIRARIFSGVVDDPTTGTYLATEAGQIDRLKEYTVTNADGGLTPPTVSTITGTPSCGNLALGYLRNIYAVCGNAIYVYTHDSSGNVPPLRVLSGSATGLNQPYGIYEGP